MADSVAFPSIHPQFGQPNSRSLYSQTRGAPVKFPHIKDAEVAAPTFANEEEEYEYFHNKLKSHGQRLAKKQSAIQEAADEKARIAAEADREMTLRQLEENKRSEAERKLKEHEDLLNLALSGNKEALSKLSEDEQLEVKVELKIRAIQAIVPRTSPRKVDPIPEGVIPHPPPAPLEAQGDRLGSVKQPAPPKGPTPPPVPRGTPSRVATEETGPHGAVGRPPEATREDSLTGPSSEAVYRQAAMKILNSQLLSPMPRVGWNSSAPVMPVTEPLPFNAPFLPRSPVISCNVEKPFGLVAAYPPMSTALEESKPTKSTLPLHWSHKDRPESAPKAVEPPTSHTDHNYKSDKPGVLPRPHGIETAHRNVFTVTEVSTPHSHRPKAQAPKPPPNFGGTGLGLRYLFKAADEIANDENPSFPHLDTLCKTKEEHEIPSVFSIFRFQTHVWKGLEYIGFADRQMSAPVNTRPEYYQEKDNSDDINTPPRKVTRSASWKTRDSSSLAVSFNNAEVMPTPSDYSSSTPQTPISGPPVLYGEGQAPNRAGSIILPGRNNSPPATRSATPPRSVNSIRLDKGKTPSLELALDVVRDSASSTHLDNLKLLMLARL